MTGMFVLILALSVFSLSAKADSTENANEYKYYTSYRIEQGESLWSISEKFMDTEHYDSVTEYMKEVKSVNGISGDKIQSGNYLLIPYFSETIK
jgi:nucleoid-associated protein YgaU